MPEKKVMAREGMRMRPRLALPTAAAVVVAVAPA